MGAQLQTQELYNSGKFSDRKSCLWLWGWKEVCVLEDAHTPSLSDMEATGQCLLSAEWADSPGPAFPGMGTSHLLPTALGSGLGSKDSRLMRRNGEKHGDMGTLLLALQLAELGITAVILWWPRGPCEGVS